MNAAETEANADDRDLLTTAQEDPDAITRPIHTRQAATTAPEKGRTATPAAEMTGNGTETAASADAEITMTDPPDAKETETFLTVVGPEGEIGQIGETGETGEAATANVTMTVSLSVSAEIGEIGGGLRRLRRGRERLRLT